jgi:hypothetical protein
MGATGPRLPQNIQPLIGEKQVLLRLSMLIHGTPSDVFHDLGEAGYDVLLQHPDTEHRIRIEVKTRQCMYVTCDAAG